MYPLPSKGKKVVMARTSYKQLVAQGKATHWKGLSLESYKELVAEGKRVTEQETNVKWLRGDLASKVEKHYGEAKLEQYAEDIEVSYSTLRDEVTTAKAWPQSARDPRKSWTVHRELNGRDDRFDLIEQINTTTELRQLLGRRPSHSGTQLPKAARVAQVREALANPEIAREIASDPKTSSIISDAIRQHREDVTDRAIERERSKNPETFDVSKFNSAIEHFNRARLEAGKAIDDLRFTNLNEDRRAAIRNAIGELGRVIDWASSLVESGNVTFEEELNELLQRGY